MTAKKYFLILFLMPIALSAQFQWESGGISVRQGSDISWSRTSVACEDGSVVVIWTDTRNGARGLYAQKIDENGNDLWSEEGIEIYNPNRMQFEPIAISSDNNSVIVCWLDYYDNYCNEANLRAQKISADGSMLWYPNGGVVVFGGANLGSLRLVPHSDGGAYILQNDGWQSYIKAKRLLSNGFFADGWSDGIDLLPGGWPFAASSDNLDGLIVASGTSDDIYCQRVDDSGTKYWGYYGTLLYNGTSNMYKLQITSCNQDYYISWLEYVYNDIDHLGIQKINLDGNCVWSEITCVYEAENITNYIVVQPSDSQPVLFWTDNTSIKAQKIATDGSLVWNNMGISVNNSGNYVYRYSIQAEVDSDNDCLISWSEESSDYGSNIKVQKVETDGQLTWTNEITISENIDNSSISSLVNMNQKYHFCWLDTIDDSSILKHQIMDINGNFTFQPNGEELYSGLNGMSWDLEMLENGDNPIILWTDERFNRDEQIYLQILNSDGSSILNENGVPVVDFSGNDQRNFDAVLGTNSNVVGIVWSEFPYANTYAQGIDTNGNYIWSDSTGIPLTSSLNNVTYSRISVVDNSGIDEYYIGYNEMSDIWERYIKAQKIIDGELQWGDDGITISDYIDCELIDVVDQYFIWEEVNWPTGNLLVKLIDENGNTAPGWPEEGLSIVNELVYYDDIWIIKSQNGIFVFWYIYQENESYIYGQLVDQNGICQWEEGGKQMINVPNLVDFNLIYNNDLYLVWSNLTDNNQCNYSAQKYNDAGEELWIDGPIQLTENNYHFSYDCELTSLDSNILFTWTDGYENTHTNIKIQILKPDGELEYGLTGYTITNQYMDQEYPKVYTSDNTAYFCWLDGRSTFFGEEGLQSIWGVYAQKFQFQPTVVDNQLPRTNNYLSNYPNPFNPSTTISFSVPQTSSFVTLEIYNLKGQKVKNLSVSLSSAQQSIEGYGKINSNASRPSTELRMTQAGSNTYSVVWDGTDDHCKPVSS
ncbi:MAG: hypothetical protein DRI23_10790, partial [Candidatus Cloacimonadota bacterium]